MMICPNCSQELIHERINFCELCGHDLRSRSVSVADTEIKELPPSRQPESPEQSQDTHAASQSAQNAAESSLSSQATGRSIPTMPNQSQQSKPMVEVVPPSQSKERLLLLKKLKKLGWRHDFKYGHTAITGVARQTWNKLRTSKRTLE